MNDSIWNKTLLSIKNIIDPLPFNTWFSNIEFIDIQDDKLRLCVPYLLYKTHIEQNYKEIIIDNFNNNSSFKINDIIFILKENLNEILDKEKENTETKDVTEDVYKPKKAINSNLNKNYTFDTFVVGESNKFAQAAALAVAENPGKMYNPLFIYGNSGLGKTHLMHAIGNYIEEKHKKRVLYVTCDQFLEDFMGLSRKNNVNNNNLDYMEFFKSKYRDIDVLIIDDIQFLGGATASQQEFFHTFNNLHNDSKQIIVSSDRSPDDLKFLEDRLRTRFCWGLQVDIAPPEFELKVAIIRKKLNGEKLKINDDVINFIASNVGNDVRQLEGSITRLVAYSVIMGVNNPTLEFAMEALKEFTKKPSGTDQNNIRRIQKSVANFYKISYEDIKSNKRPPNIAIPRQVAMYLCRKLTNESFERIGIEFGGKNHATVMHSCNKIETSLKSNMELKEAIIHIEQELK
ncbi:MAG: chromosomal replication initiator protein DnaA [Tenericutes bacterium]|nr:chromosomal replication initiator protein DnaA [Mycoplasmatota bacterium]